MSEPIQVYDGDGTITNNVVVHATDVVLVKFTTKRDRCHTPLILECAEHQAAVDAYTTLFRVAGWSIHLLQIKGALHDGMKGDKPFAGHNGMVFPNAVIENLKMVDAFRVELEVIFDEVKARWTRA